MATKPAVTSAVPPWTTYGSGARAIATPTSAGSLATMSGGEPIGAVTVGRRKATVRLGANHAARLILTHISAAAVVTLVILSLSGNTVGDARNLLTGRNLIALTGDLGSLDDAGRLRIVGRKKDMFIVAASMPIRPRSRAFCSSTRRSRRPRSSGYPTSASGRCVRRLWFRKPP